MVTHEMTMLSDGVSFACVTQSLFYIDNWVDVDLKLTKPFVYFNGSHFTVGVLVSFPFLHKI